MAGSEPIRQDGTVVPITCVIVSYNNLPWLRQAIESVLQQTVSVDEILIADDGSTDGSRDMIRAMAANCGNIRPIFRDRNLGVAANRDLAIRAARNPLITTLDGDDYYLPTKIEDELKALQHTFAAIAYSDWARESPNNQGLSYLHIAPFSRMSTRERLQYLAFHAGPRPRDMLLPKSLYVKLGGYKHNLAMYEDWDLKIRLAASHFTWKHSGSVGLIHRVNGQGLSSKPKTEHMAYRLRVLASNGALLRNELGIVSYAACVIHTLPHPGLRTLKWLRTKRQTSR